VVLANAKDRYINGLTQFRDDQANGIERWIEYFAGVASTAAQAAMQYLQTVRLLNELWRERLSKLPNAPREDATAWTIIEALPAHPIITAPVAAAVTGRSKPSVYEGITLLVDAGVLLPLTASRRNQSWEAMGLLDILTAFETMIPPR
jgi:Fic family protein